MNNKEIDDILANFDRINYPKEEELKNMDFYELAYYIQTLNKVESMYSDIESLKEVQDGTSN